MATLESLNTARSRFARGSAALACIVLLGAQGDAFARQKGPLYTPIILVCPGAVAVSVDARALATLGHATFEIMQVVGGGCQTAGMTAEVQELALTPGTYTLRAGSGAAAVTLTFTVNATCDLTLP